MTRVTKKDRQLYELLEQVSGLLRHPEAYDMRAYYATVGTEARLELIKRIETALKPYEEMREAENEIAAELDDPRNYHADEFLS